MSWFSDKFNELSIKEIEDTISEALSKKNDQKIRCEIRSIKRNDVSHPTGSSTSNYDISINISG